MDMNEHVEIGDFVHLSLENLTGMVYEVARDRLKVKFSNGDIRWERKEKLEKIDN